MAGKGWVADCGFKTCPKEFLAGLLLSDSVSLKGYEAGWELVAVRATPPQLPFPGIRLEKSGSTWNLTGVQAAPPSPCTVAGEALLNPTDASELPVESLGVRSHLTASGRDAGVAK